MQVDKLRDKAAPASALLKATSNRHRLLILCHLVETGRCVGELEELVGVSQSALSRHLARLRRDSLVKTRRDAQTIYYSLAGTQARAVIETLHRLFCQTAGRQTAERGASKPAAPKSAIVVER